MESELWTPESGLVTAAFKLKRKQLAEKYQVIFLDQVPSTRLFKDSAIYLTLEFCSSQDHIEAMYAALESGAEVIQMDGGREEANNNENVSKKVTKSNKIAPE